MEEFNGRQLNCIVLLILGILTPIASGTTILISVILFVIKSCSYL